MVVEVTREAEISLQKQDIDTEIASARDRDKKPVPSKVQSKTKDKVEEYDVKTSTTVAQKDTAKDEILERAMQIMKVRDILINNN